MNTEILATTLIESAWDIREDVTQHAPSIGFLVSAEYKAELSEHRHYDKMRGEFITFPVFYTEKGDTLEALNLRKISVIACGSGVESWMGYARIEQLRKIPLAKLEIDRLLNKKYNEIVVVSKETTGIPCDVFKFLNNCGFGFKYLKDV